MTCHLIKFHQNLRHNKSLLSKIYNKYEIFKEYIKVRSSLTNLYIFLICLNDKKVIYYKYRKNVRS